MPKLDNFFNQTKNPGLEKNGTKKMHPQNINYKKLQESSYQYRKFEPGDVEKLADLIQTQHASILSNSASWTSLHSFRAT